MFQVVYIYILLTLLFLYCALRAHVRCKRPRNSLLHCITHCTALIPKEHDLLPVI